MLRLTPIKNSLIYDNGPNIKTFISTKIHSTDVNNPKITEIAMVAMHAVDMRDQADGDGPDHLIPRVVDKLVLYFDSGQQIHTHTEAWTMLSTADLHRSQKKPFDRGAVNLIYGFLSRQERPICLFTHHGYQLEFPALKRELQSLGMTLDLVDDESVLCSDAIWVYRDMDSTARGKALVASCLDAYMYTFDSLYRRYMKESLKLDDFTAEKQAMCLLEIMRKTSSIRFKELFTCREFSVIKHITGTREAKEEEPHSVCRSLFPPHDLETQTFVFFDLETTGLNTPEMTAAMTELCMVAVHSHYVAHTADVSDASLSLPRVHDKIKIMVDPARQIESVAESLTGISNHDLEARKKQPFSHRTEKLLCDFLERQRQPVCIVAYNGNDYDFRILRDHLKRSGSQSALWLNLYTVDALVGLRELTQDSPLPSYKLSNAYCHFVEHNPHNSHTAEADVETLFGLVRVARFAGQTDNFPNWLDQHKAKFM